MQFCVPNMKNKRTNYMYYTQLRIYYENHRRCSLSYHSKYPVLGHGPDILHVHSTTTLPDKIFKKHCVLWTWNQLVTVKILVCTIHLTQMFDRTPKTLNFRRNHAVILGPLISRKLLELENRNFRHISMGPNTPFRYEHFSAKGRAGAQRP